MPKSLSIELIFETFLFFTPLPNLSTSHFGQKLKSHFGKYTITKNSIQPLLRSLLAFKNRDAGPKHGRLQHVHYSMIPVDAIFGGTTSSRNWQLLVNVQGSHILCNKQHKGDFFGCQMMFSAHITRQRLGF